MTGKEKERRRGEYEFPDPKRNDDVSLLLGQNRCLIILPCV